MSHIVDACARSRHSPTNTANGARLLFASFCPSSPRSASMFCRVFVLFVWSCCCCLVRCVVCAWSLPPECGSVPRRPVGVCAECSPSSDGRPAVRAFRWGPFPVCARVCPPVLCAWGRHAVAGQRLPFGRGVKHWPERTHTPAPPAEHTKHSTGSRRAHNTTRGEHGAHIHRALSGAQQRPTPNGQPPHAATRGDHTRRALLQAADD